MYFFYECYFYKFITNIVKLSNERDQEVKMNIEINPVL
jgi:hypothetical protein